MIRLLEFIHYLYRNKKNKLFIVIFIIALITFRLVSVGVDATTLLGFILGLASLMLMGRLKVVRIVVILVGMPCILLAIIAGYPPPEGYQNSISGFVAGGFVVLLYREYIHYRNTITK